MNLSKELATKADLATTEARLEGQMQTIRQEIQTVKVEFEGKIDRVKIELNTKLNFLIILMVIALTLMNPVVAEIIKRALKL